MSAGGFPSEDVPAIYSRTALLGTTLVTLAFVVVAELQVPWVLLPLGLFVLFVAPGYAVVALLFGARTLPSLALNIAMIVGMSVLFNAVVGTLLLYYAIAPLAPLVGAFAAVVCAAATVVQYQRERWNESRRPGQWLRSVLALPGFTPAQRTAAYALLIGVAVTFGAIGYLSTLQPRSAPDLSLAIVGPGGTTSTLPTSGTVNSTLALIVEVGNNATSQSLVLGVNSTLVGQTGSTRTTVPWTVPLHLAPNVTSSESLSLTSGETDNIQFSFQVDTGGDYAISFFLTPLQSHVAVRTSSLTVRIT